MTVLNKELTVDKDSKTVKLRTTFDVGTAIDLAKEASESPQERKSNDGIRCMGYIPPELWGYDPWLIQAKKARSAGDMGEYTKMIKKFFEVHPQYAVLFQKKIFTTR